MDELVPPAPPGEEKNVGFFKKIFSSKKKIEPSPYFEAPGLPSKPVIKPVVVSASKISPNMPPIPPPTLVSEKKFDAPQKEVLGQAATAHKDNDLVNLRSQLGLASEKKPSSMDDKIADNLSWTKDVDAKSNSKLKKDAMDSIIPAKINTSYTPLDMPPIPKLSIDTPKYKVMDFTKDPQVKDLPNSSKTSKLDEKDIPRYNDLKKPVTSLDLDSFEKKRSSGQGLDWTSELKHTKQEAPVNSEFDKPVVIIKALETQAAIKSDSALLATASVKKIDWTDHPDPTAPVSNPTVQGTLQNVHDLEIDNTGAKNMSSKDVETEMKKLKKGASKNNSQSKSNSDNNNLMAQPVQTFAEQFKQRISDQVRKEEREKILEEMDTEEREREQKLEEKMKKKLDLERAKLVQEINSEKEKIVQERLKNQRTLEDERNAIKKERATLDAEKKSIEHDFKKIEERETSINASKNELKKEKLALEDEKNEFESIIKKLPKLRSEAKILQDKIDAVEQKIKINKQIEDNLVKREESIKQAHAKLEEMEKQIRETGFSKYLEAELTEKQIKYPEEQPPQVQKDHTLPIYGLIDDCRSLLWKNNVEDAKVSYMKARDVYHDLLEKGHGSEEIYTAIRELYDDISLAGIK